VNTLISEPGTGEVDWNSLYSLTTGSLAMPSTLKYTPEGHHIAWGRTEYSVSFDAVDVSAADSGRVTQFGPAITVAGTSVLFDGGKLDIAVSPQATLLLRGDSGIRAGATAIARYDAGRNSIGGTVGWSGATQSSPTNPAGTFDVGLGLGRRLATAGALGRLTAHGNAVWERSTGLHSFASAYEGVEYQMNDRLALDLSGQHLGVHSTHPEHQIVFGITVGLGKPGH
jgi:hypothetical protein